MLSFQFRVLPMVCILLCANFTQAFDEVQDRIEAGKEFLNRSRVNQWEEHFSKGLAEFGKIELHSGGRLVVESWFEDDFMLIQRYYAERTTVILANPKYLAMVENVNGQYKTTAVEPPLGDSRYVYVDAIPFAICSSVNFRREIVPRHLQDGKIAISDYHFEEGKHRVEFELVDDSTQGNVELVFYEDSPSLLPNEAIFEKGTAGSRHFLNENFVDVKGYQIPLNLREANRDEDFSKSRTEIHPDEPLNQERCYLTYYGLPEPGEFGKVTDFGRGSRFNRVTIAWIVLGLVAVVGAGFWFRKKSGGS
jgi:hypothetical protein